jgi:hypothetical protein
MPPSKRVHIVVRSTTSRVPFRSGTYSALLEDTDARDYVVLGTTRGHPTWAKAARAALRLADQRGYRVTSRDLIARRLAQETP